MTYGPPIPYMECGDLVTWSPPHVWWDFLGQCNAGSLQLSMTYGPPYLIWMWEPCNWVLHMYDMICGSLVTVNQLWSPIPYMECRNIVTVNDSYGPPYLIWKEPCNWVPPPHPQMYDMILFRTMQSRNLVTVNDLWSPIPYTECSNLVTANDLWFPPYLIWNLGTL